VLCTNLVTSVPNLILLEMTVPGSPTLRSRQRARVLDTYRGRGHRNSNLWLVYSVKQNQDILLHSDRSLVHWLAFLETDPTVLGFRPVADQLGSLLQVNLAAATIVERPDRKREVHLIGCGNQTETIETGVGPATIRVISEEELQNRSRIALRWLQHGRNSWCYGPAPSMISRIIIEAL
jgi:hypothetical protein